MNRNSILGALLGVALFAGSASAQDFVVDTAHTNVNFTVRHLLAKVRGQFNKFSGEFTWDAKKIENSKVVFEIDAASIDTNNAKRDDHLRSGDFFLVEKHPKLIFKSTKVVSEGSGFKIHGNLTMRGVTKPIVLDAVFLGMTKDAYGRDAAAFQATTKVNRKDFGIAWSKITETGSIVVGDDVEIELFVEANPKPAK